MLLCPEAEGIFRSREHEWGIGLYLDRIDPAAHPGTDFAHFSMTTVISDRARIVFEDLAGAWLTATLLSTI